MLWCISAAPPLQTLTSSNISGWLGPVNFECFCWNCFLEISRSKQKTRLEKKHARLNESGAKLLFYGNSDQSFCEYTSIRLTKQRRTAATHMAFLSVWTCNSVKVTLKNCGFKLFYLFLDLFPCVSYSRSIQNQSEAVRSPLKKYQPAGDESMVRCPGDTRLRPWIHQLGSVWFGQSQPLMIRPFSIWSGYILTLVICLTYPWPFANIGQVHVGTGYICWYCKLS